MRLHPSDRKALALSAVILLHLGAFALLLRPMLIATAQPETATILLDIPAPPPPAPAPEAEQPGTPEPQAAAAPPARRAKPKPLAAPPPIVQPEPKPSPVAPAPSTGTQVQSGAATAGPGTGAGGNGFGAGAGGTGSGQGGGGGSRPRWKSGGMTRKDLPAELRRSGVTGSVTARLTVTPEGRASNCRITTSSGIPALDQLTCRLIEQRFRYTPAKDNAGNPVSAEAGWRQDWWLEPPASSR